MYQTTLKDSVSVSGIGLHTGANSTVALHPGIPGRGILFKLGDGEPFWATIAQVENSYLATTLKAPDGKRVMTVEHLLAALYGYGVNSCLIEVEGPEIPASDGSALTFVEAIESVGVTTSARTQFGKRILKPVRVSDGDRWATLVPSEAMCLELSIEIEFNHPMIGRQTFSGSVERSTFLSEIASARTFGFGQHASALHAEGRALGANENNTLVLDDDGLLPGQILHSADEFVRHKALDALGDIALAGHPLLGRYEAYMPGHSLNHLLLTALAADHTAWEYANPE